MWYKYNVPPGTTTRLEVFMKGHDSLFLLLFGFALWLAGTIYYELRGPVILETTSRIYWINFILSPILSSIVCILILRGRHIPQSAWGSAALLLALPGMIGEAVLLANFSSLMPRLQPASGGKYAAFLFAAYALFLGIAEMVSLKAVL
jgi:hypothetical protein